MPLPPLSARRRHTHCRYHTRRLHTCRRHIRRYTLPRPPPPRRHRPAAPAPLSHCHRAARDTLPAAAAPASETPPLTVYPSPEAAGKWPEDSSNPHVHGQHTGTRGMVHPLLCRVAQHQPNKYRSKTIQKPSNNRTTTVQQPYNNRTKTVQKPAQQPPAKTSKNTRPIRPIAIQNENPLDPKGGAGAHPPPHCATARRGRPEAYPKGRPHPQDPKGGAGATPRQIAPRRDGGARRPTRRAAPTVKKVTPRPLR